MPLRRNIPLDSCMSSPSSPAFRQRANADVIIVLGGGIRRDGSLTAVSRARVVRAAELYQEGVASRLILTGRCGVFLHKQVSEASAMHTHARGLGVPADALLLEEQARNTLGNARFTRELFLAPNGWYRVRIVTSDFHARRAESLFRSALGGSYDVSMSTASSGSTFDELALRILEPIKLLGLLLAYCPDRIQPRGMQR